MDGRRTAAVAFWLAASLLGSVLPIERKGERPAGSPPERGAARLLWDLPLDLNREDARTFEALPGIGPTRARAIAAARPFCRVSDLQRIPGIGPVTLGRLAKHVFVLARPAVCGD
jgi:competence protein ComEA